ncbi:MAG TPA: MFS transporter [Candidatus Absconditabacterales bacterium]|nr:MFS transporter [Candidatus Absconditabacterales bacterium]
MKKIKRIVIFTLFLDMLGMTIMIPAYPNLVAYYHTDYFMISLGVTLFSLFGLFSTPILGAISDKYGRKIVLLVSVISSLLSYGLIWISGNIWIFLLSRIVNGAAAGNISSIQSILTDIAVDHKERTANFGLFGAVFGVGFIIGPAIGGWLLGYGVKMPFIVSFFLALLNVLFIIRGLPETNKFLVKAKKISLNIVTIFKNMFTSPEKKYYLVFFIINLALMVYQMSFTLFLNERFGVAGETSGYFMALIGLVMVINQGFLLKGFWLKRFTNKRLVGISILGMIICYGLAFFASSLWLIVALVAVSGVFQGIFRPVFQDMILGNNHDIGLINGNMAALGNFANIFGPLAGGYMIDLNISPFGLVTVLLVMAYIYSKKYLTKSIA